MSSKTAVVLLNWNGIHLLKQFLPEVIACSSGASIVVADNASNDGSVAMLKSDFPDVRIIEIASNKGFTGGYNEALQQIGLNRWRRCLMKIQKLGRFNRKSEPLNNEHTLNTLVHLEGI
jgi:GT2 family glycosyltransferase